MDELAACDRLNARIPDAQIWLVRVGSRYLHRFGGRDSTLHEMRRAKPAANHRLKFTGAAVQGFPRAGTVRTHSSSNVRSLDSGRRPQGMPAPGSTRLPTVCLLCTME